MHNSDNYDFSRSVSSEQVLEAGQYIVRLKISAVRYQSAPTLPQVIERNSKEKRSKLMQLASNYDIAHAKGLGYATLRARHAQRERAALEAKRRAEEKKSKEKGEKAEERVDDNSDYKNDLNEWNNICVAGLKAYSHDPELKLEVKQHYVLGMKNGTTPEGISGQ